MLFMGLPAIAFIFVFKYLTLFGVMIAFQRYRTADGVFGSQFVGLKNFEFMFKTPQIWVALRNTLLYNSLFIILGTMSALLIAFLIYEVYNTTFARIYQTTLFLPSFISWVVVSYFLIALLNLDDGLLNQWLASMGLAKMDWFRTPEAWPYIFVVIAIWKGAGSGSLLYLATMLGIDQELFEAARIDGANKWEEFRYIMFPLLTPLIIIQTLIAIGGVFNSDFGLFYIATRLASNQQLLTVAETVDTFVYRSLVGLQNIGMAAAAGLFQATAGFILVLVSNWLVRRIDPDRSLF